LFDGLHTLPQFGKSCVGLGALGEETRGVAVTMTIAALVT